MTALSLTESSQLLAQGSVIAYPTEAVFGLGCDPNNEIAVLNLLKLKNRSPEKGLILIAHHFDQLIPYINEALLSEKQKQLIKTPHSHAITWLVPKNKNTPNYLTGHFNTIAVRIIHHTLSSKLCQLFGKPIVSTSANLSGLAPCKTINEVETQFGKSFPILLGETGKQIRPSEIRDIETNTVIRSG